MTACHHCQPVTRPRPACASPAYLFDPTPHRQSSLFRPCCRLRKRKYKVEVRKLPSSKPYIIRKLHFTCTLSIFQSHHASCRSCAYRAVTSLMKGWTVVAASNALPPSVGCSCIPPFLRPPDLLGRLTHVRPIQVTVACDPKAIVRSSPLPFTSDRSLLPYGPGCNRASPLHHAPVFRSRSSGSNPLCLAQRPLTNPSSRTLLARCLHYLNVVGMDLQHPWIKPALDPPTSSASCRSTACLTYSVTMIYSFPCDRKSHLDDPTAGNLVRPQSS